MGQADRQSRRKQPGSQPASKPANTVVAEDCAVFCSVLCCQPCHQLVVRYVPILALLPDAVYMFTNGWENLRFTIPPLTIPPFVVSPRGPKEGEVQQSRQSINSWVIATAIASLIIVPRFPLCDVSW